MRDGHDAGQAKVKSSESSLVHSTLSNVSTSANSKLTRSCRYAVSIKLNVDSMRLEGLDVWRINQVLPVSDDPDLCRLCQA